MIRRVSIYHALPNSSVNKQSELLNNHLADGYEVIGYAHWIDEDEELAEVYTLYKPDEALTSDKIDDILERAIELDNQDSVDTDKSSHSPKQYKIIEPDNTTITLVQDFDMSWYVVEDES